MTHPDIECALMGFGIFTFQTKFQAAIMVQENMGFAFTVRTPIHGLCYVI